MLNGLSYFGIVPDEGVIGENEEKGGYGPYYQSQRKEIYQTFAKRLVEEGYAYPCFCTAEELEELRGFAGKRGYKRLLRQNTPNAGI